MRVRRCCDRARVPVAHKCREQRALSHAVSVRGPCSSQQRHLRHSLVHGERVEAAVRPVGLRGRDGDDRLLGVAHEVGRDEDFDAVLLWEAVVFRVGAGDEHAAVVHEDGFRMVHAGDGGVC